MGVTARIAAPSLAGMVLAACSWMLPTVHDGLPITEVDTEPRDLTRQVDPGVAPTGPIVEVLRATADGSPMAFAVFSTADGVCYLFSLGDTKNQTCGSAPGDVPDFGHFGTFAEATSPDGPVEITGVVAQGIAAVEVETEGGGSARATLVDLSAAEVDGQGFIALLPRGSVPTALVALDGMGGEVSRVAISPMDQMGPPGGPTPSGP